MTQTLEVTNNEPAGSLALKGSIVNGKANGLSVTGGNCRDEKLKAGKSCKYKVQLKGLQANSGSAISTQFNIVGTFGAGVCPKGDVQSMSVTLAGFVN